jgi:hypothetical protein
LGFAKLVLCRPAFLDEARALECRRGLVRGMREQQLLDLSWKVAALAGDSD